MDLEVFATELLPKVKENLNVDFDNDDEHILRLTHSAIEYAQRYQNKVYPQAYKTTADVPHSTVQGIIMLASHWYESRDGSTAGYFSNTQGSMVVQAAERLFSAHKDWKV